MKGQIGLELTPDDYVAALVGVFREVRRVLADDGVVWLNLADSYAAGGKGGGGSFMDQRREAAWQKQSTLNGWRRQPDGFKEKDLLGIPWSVAKALQAPYYAGRIRSDRDRLWLAALVDTEGCIHVHRRPAGQSAYSSFTKKDGSVSQYARTQDTFGVMVSVDNTSQALIDRCADISGQGSRYVHRAGAGKSNRKQTLYRWTVTGQQARDLLRELYPDLVAKRQQARLAYWSDSSGADALQSHAVIKGLHQGILSGVDAPPPPSLYEQGFYLRSDIIWGKPNPMPESVTDRCTKSHEYLFMLTKSERYFFDSAAIAERGSDALRVQIEQGYDGAGVKDYAAAGVQNPSAVKARIIDGARKRAAVAQHKQELVGNNQGGYLGTNEPFLLRNKRSVWTIPTMPYAGAHFATMPEALVEPCILAGSRLGDLILDPFSGSGTVLAVAERTGRRSVGVDLNPAYHQLAKQRTAQRGLRFESAVNE